MLDKDIQPNTIGGIKRYAKQIKKEYGIPHSEALNKAAQKACFENYSHALNSLSESKATKSQYRLFFSTYWHDKSSRTFGREVLEIKLPKPLLEIATKSDMKKANGLSWFRLASLDHFVHDQVIRSQETARDSICKAVRELRFMEATGLKPTNDYEAAYPNRDPNNKLPQTDHATNWEDPDSGQFILVDEPYLGPVITGERAEWADKHSWHLQASKWQGMYYPGESQMFIATDATTGYDFTSLMEKIDNIPSPITTENWNSESSFGHDIFLSPQAITPQDKKRAIARGTIHREPSSKTVPMRRSQLVNEVKKNKHPNFHVIDVNGEEYVRANPNKKKIDNVDK